jgi:hypothetical protein
MREHTYTFVQWARGCIVAFVGAVFGATFGVFVAWTQILKAR